MIRLRASALFLTAMPAFIPRCSTLWKCLAMPACLLIIGTSVANSGESGVNPEVLARGRELLHEMPVVQRRFEGISQSEVERRLRREKNFAGLAQERLSGEWFAVLVRSDGADPLAIERRFPTWKSFADFLHASQAIVDVWTIGEGGTTGARRVPATELGELARTRNPPPTFVTVTFAAPEIGTPATYRVEFGFGAAEHAFQAKQAYLQHRELQVAVQQVLSARNAQGELDAFEQWSAMMRAQETSGVRVSTLPEWPRSRTDLWVAAEFEVDRASNFIRVIRFYREHQIQKRIVRGRGGAAEQWLELKDPKGKARLAEGFLLNGVTDELVPAPSPVLGQDYVELRVVNPDEPDPRKWNILEFGEPEVLKQSALAKFSLISAHMDRKRKEIALKKSRLDLWVEPLIAGLNIGGGVSGLGFPAGDAARLGYNLITPKFISDVPTVKELRELFGLLAAKERVPDLKAKPAEFLTEKDIERLKAATRRLTDREIEEHLEHISDDDLDAMLRLARMQRADARISNFLNILTSAGKASGVTEERGILRDIFNNAYFSVSGDVNLKTILAVALGQRVMTPLSGVSLEHLSQGGEPSKAWLQFFDVSVDVRAIINSLARLPKKSFAEKEIQKPFPYALDMADLAAYEIRLFGYPLFIYYKRGLMKDDFQAFHEDYAYGLDGANIVVHFRNKEDMDREIRAGRMAPIGFVRVPDGRGGWKETNLAVFAYEIPEGRRHGRMAIIIYGLKAYHEHSEFVEREYERFRQFQAALREGAVIIKLENAQDRSRITPADFEPRIIPGAQAVQDLYAPMLGLLLEKKRQAQFQQWGSEVELGAAEIEVEKRLRAAGYLHERSELIGVDAYHSSFIMRTWVDGQWRDFKWTSIADLASVERALAKAEDEREIEQWRKATAHGETPALVFLNHAVERDGRIELGPLLTDASGKVEGIGVLSEPGAAARFLERLEEGPVLERVRLNRNYFSATLIDGSKVEWPQLGGAVAGRAKPVFVTVEFPAGLSNREATNSISGERERRTYASGRLVSVTTSRRMTELSHDEHGLEVSSRTYANAGSLARPMKGPLLEETRTLEHIFRAAPQDAGDLLRPTMLKLRANYVMGTISRETYGAFPLPVQVVDDQFVTENRFNEFGMWIAGAVMENGSGDGPTEPSLRSIAIEPRPGRARFNLRTVLAEPGSIRTLRPFDFKNRVISEDVIHGTIRTNTYDNSNFGRLSEESFSTTIAGQTYVRMVSFSYRDDTCFGLVPWSTHTRSTGREVSATRLLNYDAMNRQLTAVAVDATGRIATNRWDYRWPNPVESVTALRRTTSRYNGDQTSVESVTTSVATGEELGRSRGRFDAGSGQWRIDQVLWFGPGTTNRTETLVLNKEGWRLATRYGANGLEARPIYDADGLERGEQVFAQREPSGPFDLLVREEDDYQFNAGQRESRVRTHLDGKPHDEYRKLADAEGRLVIDRIRRVPGLELKTVVQYDGSSDRVLRSEQLQNGQWRTRYEVGPIQEQPNGAVHLRVQVVPAGGLTSTQTFVLGDPLARPIRVEYENGDRAEVTDWFPGAAEARVTLVNDRYGQPKERFVRQTNEAEGVVRGPAAARPYGEWPKDLTFRYRLGPWGGAGLMAKEATLRGTDLLLSSETANERVYYDIGGRSSQPWFAVDVSGQRGMRVQVKGQTYSSVTKLFWVERVNSESALAESDNRAELIQLRAIDLSGLFNYTVDTQIKDGTGQTVQATIAQLSPLLLTDFSDGVLHESAARAPVIQRVQYRYVSGWLVEERDNASGRMLRFTESQPPAGASHRPVNNAGWREFATHIDAFNLNDPVGTGRRETAPYCFERSYNPRWLERNPHLPGRASAWMAWQATKFGSNGEKLFDQEVIYDGMGRQTTVRTARRGHSGEPAYKLSYLIPEPSADEWKSASPGDDGLVPLGMVGDGSTADFLYCFVRRAGSGAVEVFVGENEGDRIVQIGGTNSVMRFWWPSRANVQWLPDPIFPEHAAVVQTASVLPGDVQLVVLSAPELESAGVDRRRLGQIRLKVANSEDVQVSGMFAAQHGSRRIAVTAAERVEWQQSRGPFGARRTSSGLSEDLATQAYQGHHLNSVLEVNGLPLAITHRPVRYAGFPNVVFVDQSVPELARPLYAISPETGRFVEHYRVVRSGPDTYVYTVIHGFGLPKVEVFGNERLEDEITPNLVAYGRDYHVRVRYTRGRGWIAKSVATLYNRVGANMFKYSGDQLLTLFSEERLWTGLDVDMDYASLHDARIQAHTINHELPMFAEAMRPIARLPWEDQENAARDLRVDEKKLAGTLLRLHVRSFSTNVAETMAPTYLIPTAIGTAAERYVDTVQEADLIRLASSAGENGLAASLLSFYWQKSQGGLKPLQSSYDAEAGTAMRTNVLFQRPMQAKPTAESQLAMAEAAFTLAIETKNRGWFEFGKNLVNLLLNGSGTVRPFRSQFTNDIPRGLTEDQFDSVRGAERLMFWPAAQQYSVRSNARAYLLFRRLNALPLDLISDSDWRTQIGSAQQELEQWLRTHILPQVDRTGMVPQGVFQIQDIHRRTSALAVERWTSTLDWLTFLEAADAMGVPREKTHRWLENLARVHQVRVGEQAGLDWTLALLRPGAISTECTAYFWRVARLLGHSSAERYAAHCLRELEQNGTYPVTVTSMAPQLPFASGQGFFIFPDRTRTNWPGHFGVYKEIIARPWNVPDALALGVRANERGDGGVGPPTDDVNIDPAGAPIDDRTVFLMITGAFYASILLSALFWWRFRALRKRNETPGDTYVTSQLMSETTMGRAEERWAKRVLGVQTPDGAEHTRFSNSTVEQNFLIPLRVIYKLVLEWRRQENQWAEDDPRLVEDESDDWLNGMDEFASVVGIYMRWVIKAGAKDGFRKEDVMEEHEDSNHIWSRLMLFFSENYWGLLTLMKSYDTVVLHEDKANLYGQISELLKAMGVRQRARGFDARQLFNYPANPAAMDLLVIQKPGMTLSRVMLDASMKLKIPYTHLQGFVEKYKAFKQREKPYPIHPYTIELAKLLPHFFLMGLGALVWYNHEIVDSPIVSYLWSLVVDSFAGSLGSSLIWLIPLGGALVMSVLAHFTRVYRFEGSMLAREKPGLFLDATLTSFFIKKYSAMPGIKSGRWWKPDIYERTGWGLRAFGFLMLGLHLLNQPTPSFATFLVTKGLLAMLAFVEVAAVILPLFLSWVSFWFQERGGRPDAWKVTSFINRLNITATRPASPLWLSIKYHTQPSVPSGDFWSMTQCVLFYFFLAGVFLVVGGYLCQEILSLWFTDTFLISADWKLFLGSLLFWNTMYLLRYGLFLLCTGIAAALAAFPIKSAVAALAFGQIVIVLGGPMTGVSLNLPLWFHMILTLGGIGLILAEDQIRGWFRDWRRGTPNQIETPRVLEQRIAKIKQSGAGAVGIVYMGGDDLSSQKLTATLLMERWNLLREKLDSRAIQLLLPGRQFDDHRAVEAAFAELFELEKKCDVTLWHPMQLTVRGRPGPLRPELGLNLDVETSEERERLLAAWHARRWLVSMMSSAGHSQDTAVTLVDIALRLHRDGLGGQAVFYLIQNKYDNNENNRPVQSDYRKGELGQRNKLARLLTEVAPGARAYNVQNWTPFGFKAGGLTGMDLVAEESLGLNTLLILDRNATVHDLDAFMLDLTNAMSDPNVVIVIPGRGTTNTLTALGQGSQLVEEGHRSFLKGLMGWLGGRASEGVGTGWGNLLATYYGRVQRAMVDWQTLKMPLTSRMQRGSSFAMKAEGLIGFAPHAVGISEDTWAVSQAAHTAVAFGARVKFLVSNALWHKIRETWSHSEWLASFPRWSGGYLQMMHDPLMQKINDFGAASVFAKEVRANSGRNFLSAPFALLNILLMPLAIMLDLTPFVQILVVLWNFGFIMNQVLTLNGLNTYLESTGFYRVPALIGGVATALTAAMVPALAPVAFGLVALGTLYGGFMVGLHRWLFYRLRDVVIFGPQLVLHALGQLMRQTLEFVMSGASPADAKGVNMAFRAWVGPREDRPLDRFPHFINLKTVIWVVGMFSIVLNLFALSNLDMLNVLLLLPSLMFSVSVFVGPFIMKPKMGKPLGNLIVLPKTLAWIGAFVFYMLVSQLIAGGGWLTALGTVLWLGMFVILLAQALRYVGFRRRLARLARQLSARLTRAGLAAPVAEKLAQQLVPDATVSPAQIESRLEQAGVAAEARGTVVAFIRESIAPVIRKPADDLRKRRFAQNRFVSEFNRAFVLALFVLIWFLIVPVPGLFIFTAGRYRISVELWAIVTFVAWSVGVVLAGFWLGRLVQWREQRGLGKRRGLETRVRETYQVFQDRLTRGENVAADQCSALYALFTEMKLYIDQRSYAYAWRSLRQAEQLLRRL